MMFPHENSMNDRDGQEEERRLMYVAITRARKRLCHFQTRILLGSVHNHNAVTVVTGNCCFVNGREMGN